MKIFTLGVGDKATEDAEKTNKELLLSIKLIHEQLLKESKEQTKLLKKIYSPV